MRKERIMTIKKEEEREREGGGREGRRERERYGGKERGKEKRE